MIKEVRTNASTFRAVVNDGGYEWLNDDDGKLRLVPRHEPGMGSRSCDIAKGLFLAFAKLPPTKEAIQEFAGAHGDLFAHRYEPHQSACREDGTAAFGATHTRWKQEIGDMLALVTLWGQIQNRSGVSLRTTIWWTQKAVGYEIKTPRGIHSATLANADSPQTGFKRFNPRDVVLPARCALQLEINKRLAEQPTVPRLAWTPDTPENSLSGYNQRVVMESPNLLGAMWLQFARAVTGEFQFKTCEVCGAYFQVGPGARRADSTTCKNACRQRKHNEKKASLRRP
jgi:hypothetical protein